MEQVETSNDKNEAIIYTFWKIKIRCYKKAKSVIALKMKSIWRGWKEENKRIRASAKIVTKHNRKYIITQEIQGTGINLCNGKNYAEGYILLRNNIPKKKTWFFYIFFSKPTIDKG